MHRRDYYWTVERYHTIQNPTSPEKLDLLAEHCGMRDGLSVMWVAVLCPFCKPSMGRSVHHECMRNTLRNLPPIIPATACHERNYVETYSRSMR